MSIIPHVQVRHVDSAKCLAIFGYTSSYNNVITIPNGSRNIVSGSISSHPSVPTVFQPGYHAAVFTVEFDCSYIEWHIQPEGKKYSVIAVNNTCAPDVPDCSGVCGGDKALDCSGVCGGDNTIDCNGVCGGTSAVDCSGICGGDAFVSDGQCVRPDSLYSDNIESTANSLLSYQESIVNTILSDSVNNSYSSYGIRTMQDSNISSNTIGFQHPPRRKNWSVMDD